MANLRSAIKRIRSNQKKQIRNRIIRSRARSAVAAARASHQPSSRDADIRKAIRELDKAASKGVIHKNNAARRKSRLMKKMASQKKAGKSKS